ncbi:MAG: DUF2279 domain-containing protein [Bacteroidetes bacterium]|nr:DUF2279 domain-containing protein [Bacteroidota bacterium]
MTIYVAHKLIISLWAFLSIMIWCHTSMAQQDSTKLIKQQHRVTLVSTAAYSAALVGLHQLWYKDYQSTSFRFFNDNAEWMQMDKIGHIGSVYYLSKFNYSLYSYYGASNGKSVLLGTTSAMTFFTAIEIMDGFSSGWGFSAGDMIANTSGALLFAGQQLLWNETRIDVKFSFSPSPYAGCRPSLLGSSFTQQLLKDYNGQTYWLSANISDFLRPSSTFPQWLNVAVGYGATAMTGARHNVFVDGGCLIDNNERQRKFYLSPDINLNKIKTRKKWLKTSLYILSFIKVPLPAIEFQNSKTRVHWLKF